MIGNFADLLPEKPKDFDYLQDAKWIEDYPFGKRECIGGTVCSCRRIEVHYAPYYGWDHYHVETCNLMRKLRDKPQLGALWPYDHLPAIQFTKKSVPASFRVPLYIKSISRRQNIKVKVIKSNNTLPLFTGDN